MYVDVYRLRNLTSHPINLLDKNNEIVRTWEPDQEEPPRAQEVVVDERTVATTNGLILPITSKDYGKVKNLPNVEPGVLLIVSRIVAEAATDRDDLIVPNTVRDKNGTIIGCRSFSVVGG